jgi:exodeoxyribonuclease V beta subunit
MSSVTIDEITPFDVLEPLPAGRLALEASAGTGKTWTIAALVLRYVAHGEATLDELLVVTFTRAATAELRDRIRRRLAAAHAHLGAVAAGAPNSSDDAVLTELGNGPPEEIRKRAGLVAAALASFDAATITTIHGFCHRVLAASGFAGDVDGSGQLTEDVDELVRAATSDLLVSHWADTPVEQQSDRPKPPVAQDIATLALREPDATIRPDHRDREAPAKGRALARIAHDARTHVDRRKRALGLVTFDDLLTRLHRSLVDPVAGEAIRSGMRRRYAVALIDEFQDTDPTQWAILRDLFADRALILIGDPKQAIYRFRGADVQAYLDAVDHPGTDRATLTTNHRSDQRLVTAVNRLFAGTSFGDDRIVHREVAAAHQHDRLTFPDGVRPVLQVRALLEASSADGSRARIADDLAAELSRLLVAGAEVADAVADGGVRPLVPGDCAVLVRSNVQADQVKAALTGVGVHAVINGVGSVLDSAAARDWQQLLEALERPSSPSRVRALALSPVVGRSPAEVADLDELAEARQHDRAHRWARVADERGVASLIRTIQRETALLPRLLGEEGGERWLADFEHVGELLHGAAASERLGPSALIGWLTDQASRTDELPPDQRARRLESDARAVQILTIHRAKGLQFPVVFCPFVMSTGMSPRVPHRFRDPVTGDPVIDVGSAEAGSAGRRVREEDLGEQLRLLYVAMTRAEHRLVTWWWPFNTGKKGYCDSALSKLLFCSDDDRGRVRGDRKAPVLDIGPELAGELDRAVERLGADAEWVEVPDTPAAVDWQLPEETPAEPVARTFTGRIDRTWQRASYSGLIRPRPRSLVIGTPDAVPGRDDEDDLDAAPAAAAADLDLHRRLPLDEQPAGASFGTVVHAVLEHVDLAADPLADAVAEETVRQVRRGGLAVDDPSGLAGGLVAALRTPLGPGFDDVTLAGTRRRDRLDELEFELPLAHGDGRVSLAAIAELLRVHLPADDPFAVYPDQLDDRTLARDVHGYLTGSIDLVLRRTGPDGVVFHVIDHKSNRLYAREDTGSTWHYRPAAMIEVMQRSHYLLQALLYQAALHRFLRWRQPGYDPARHLGAVGYTFLRGMIGPETPLVGGMRCGVLAWQPPVALVTGLSQLLEEGR